MDVDLTATWNVLADVDVERADEIGRSRRGAADNDILSLNIRTHLHINMALRGRGLQDAPRKEYYREMMGAKLTAYLLQDANIIWPHPQLVSKVLHSFLEL